MSTAVKSYTEKFVAHENVVVHFIKSQGSTHGKAIIEAIMNSVDAKATAVHITIDSNSIKIEDDGKGFESVKQVRHVFNVFGQPHVASEDGLSTDARYGTFRVGRGQLFRFGINLWESNKYSMLVDCEKHGMKYKLDVHRTLKFKGCRVNIELYKPLETWTYNHTISELELGCKYVSIPVYVNGRCLSQNPDTDKWDIVNDDVYMRIGNAHGGQGIEVYNDGIFVETIYKSYYGCTGVVCTRKPLHLNTSRSQVIRDCELWVRIVKLIKEQTQDTIRRKSRLTDDEISAVWVQWRDGTFNIHDFRQSRIFKDITGVSWSLSMLRTQASHTSTKRKFELDLSGRLRIAFAEASSSIADRVMQHGKGIVLDICMLKLAGVKTPEEFLTVMTRGHYTCDKLFAMVSLNHLNNDVEDSGHKLIDPRLLTKVEKRIIDFLNSAWNGRSKLARESGMRVIRLGVSTGADGWTDGSSYIAINRKWLSERTYGSVSNWVDIINLLAHEYCHDDASDKGHIHDEHFYRDYHDWVLRKSASVVDYAYSGFLAKLRQGNVNLKSAGAIGEDREAWRIAAMEKLQNA